MSAQGNTKPNTIEAFILAGGLSTRMGRDKSRVRLGSLTMLARIKQTTAGIGLKTRVIRTDAVARCGPLGGIYTALKRSRADAVLILACDMPLVSGAFLKRLLRALGPKDNAVFAHHEGRSGFPLLLRRESCLPLVSDQISQGEFSLQSLARILDPRRVAPADGTSRNLLNFNTPADLEKARPLTNPKTKTPANGFPSGRR